LLNLDLDRFGRIVLILSAVMGVLEVGVRRRWVWGEMWRLGMEVLRLLLPGGFR